MLIGALTIFLVAKAPVSPAIAIATLVVVCVGYSIDKLPFLERLKKYVETFLLSLSVFLLMVPSVSETLRRVPDGHPIVADPDSPILKVATAILAVMLVVGLAVQLLYLARFGKKTI